MTTDPFDTAFLAGAVRARLDREGEHRAADQLADDLARMDALAEKIRATVPTAVVRRDTFTLHVDLAGGAKARLVRQTEGDWRLAIAETALDADPRLSVHSAPARSFEVAVRELAGWLGRRSAR